MDNINDKATNDLQKRPKEKLSKRDSTTVYQNTEANLLSSYYGIVQA